MSSLVTLDEARSHCKSDPADDAALQRALDAAEKTVQNRCGRFFYADQTALDTAVAGVAAAQVAANALYTTEMAAAAALGTVEDVADAEAAAANKLRVTKLRLSYIADGEVVSDEVISAILLVCGHLYRNREEVLTGQNAAAIALPMGVDALLASHRVVGPL